MPLLLWGLGLKFGANSSFTQDCILMRTVLATTDWKTRLQERADDHFPSRLLHTCRAFQIACVVESVDFSVARRALIAAAMNTRERPWYNGSRDNNREVR